ncbi:MAG: hypothetical protein R3B72_44595 [Polyangiaceae bacterium]
MVIRSVLNLAWLSVAPIYWVTFLADGVVQASLGLLLGIWDAQDLHQATRGAGQDGRPRRPARPKQGVLGLVAIGIGAWMVIAGSIFSVA